MNELEVKDLEVALPGVTVLSYDLDTTETPDIFPYCIPERSR